MDVTRFGILPLVTQFKPLLEEKYSLLILEVMIDLSFGFPTNNIISL